MGEHRAIGQEQGTMGNFDWRIWKRHLGSTFALRNSESCPSCEVSASVMSALVVKVKVVRGGGESRSRSKITSKSGKRLTLDRV